MRDNDSRWCYMRQICGDVFDVIRLTELAWLGPNRLQTARMISGSTVARVHTLHGLAWRRQVASSIRIADSNQRSMIMAIPWAGASLEQAQRGEDPLTRTNRG